VTATDEQPVEISVDEVAATSRLVESRWARAAIGAGLFALAVVLPLLRQRGVRSWATVWAEDGRNYTQQAMLEGGVDVLFRAYSGYLQLPPRLLAAFTPLVPVEHLARYLALSGVLVAALLAWFVYWSSVPWITSRPVRLALASLIVLMPALGGENTANITNTIWVCAAVAPWALLSPRDRGRDVAVCASVAFVAACATALSVMYVPLALGYVLVRRTRASMVTAGAFCLGLLVQSLVVLRAGEEGVLDRQANNLDDMARLLSSRVFANYLVGYEGAQDLWEASSGAATLGSTIVVVILFAVLLPRAGRRAQMLSIVLAAYSVIGFAFPVGGRGTDYLTVGGLGPDAGAPRFSVIPVFLLASAVAVLVAPDGRGRDRLVARVARPVFVAQVALLAVLGFAVTNDRSRGPTWKESVETTYELECVDAPASKVVEVPTSLERFTVSLECGDLR
jgi:hypothetical protein